MGDAIEASTPEHDDEPLKHAEHAEQAAVLVAGALLLKLGLWALGEIELTAGDFADLAARGLDELGQLAALVGLRA